MSALAKVNHKILAKAVMAEVVAGNAVYIEGHAGVGKTSFIHTLIAEFKEKGYPDVKFEKIDCASLGEKELSGIPLAGDKAQRITELRETFRVAKEAGLEFDEVLALELLSMQIEYAVHPVIRKLWEHFFNGHVPALFMDEFNRSDESVLNETMPILLEGAVHTAALPPGTIRIASGNPDDSENEDDTDLYYGTRQMNVALKDRLTIYELRADAEVWLKWASELIKEPTADGEGVLEYSRIDEDIIEFIATNPDFIHKPGVCTPRGWERASKSKRSNEELGNDAEIIHLSLAGIVGTEPSSTFMSFLNDRHNPIIKPEEILNDKPLSESMIQRIQNESTPRAAVTARNIANYLSKQQKYKDQWIENFVKFLDSIPKDNMFGVISEMVQTHKDVHRKLSAKEAYVDLYFETSERLQQA